MPDIELRNIRKEFDEGRVIALNNVNLKIKDGDFAFLLGPSGCGKTTMLKTISGLIQPTSGKVFIDGIDVTDKPPQQRGIAFIFQDFNIFPISVFENCTYALKVQGFTQEYIIQEGEKALELVGLLDRADEIPIGWGNGDLQRLGLARAICSGAKILIMDEPLGSLDPKISAEFRWELRAIIKDQKLTAIQVTHNQEEAMTIGDYIIVMRDGHLLQQNKPEVLYRFPNSIFVANFLGGINILEGYIRKVHLDDNYDVRIRLGGPTFTIHSSDKKFSLDENVIVSFRFEDVYLFPLQYDFEHSQANWTDIVVSDGEVLEKFLTGKDLRFIVELDNGDTLTVAKPEVFQYHFDLHEGVKIGFFNGDLRLFKYPENLSKEMDLQ
ncbi:MAG: ABC transporter ATP-binding protein [Candidatus Lokiarchaeota archaeon]|nr:ABC transporter ATP-binding protein [Candidatus Lokiarchaeota archaeon]